MSFDLAVWEGERPASDEIALTVFLSLLDRWQGDDSPEVLEASTRGEQTTHDPSAASWISWSILSQPGFQEP